MTRDRYAAYVLALCLAAAAVAKLLRLEISVRDLGAVVRGLGIGRLGGSTLTWLAAGLVTAEFAIAMALVTSRHRRRGLVALLLLIACGIACIGVASRWGARKDFGCPCGLGFDLPPFASFFASMLLRDAALVALAAIAWGPDNRAAAAARVRPT